MVKLKIERASAGVINLKVSLQQTYNFKPVILEQVITEQDQDAVTGQFATSAKVHLISNSRSRRRLRQPMQTKQLAISPGSLVQVV